MNRFDIINRIGDKYRVGNTETGEFSYAQALKTVGKDIKDYQKATTGTQHKFLDIRFENERLVVLVECKNKFSRWDKAKIQGQLQDYVRFEKAYSDKKIVAILAETDGDEVWVWFGQSVIIDDEHRMEEETVLRTFEEYENLCFGRVNDKIKVVDSIKTLNEKLHSDGINEKLRSQFVGTCLLALKNGLVYKNVKETLDPKTGKKLAPERVVLKSIKDILDFKQYLQDQIPAVTGFCIKVILSIIVFFVGRKIIHWLLKIMRRSLERANVDAGVVQFASSAGKAILYILLIINIAVSLGVKESSVAALLGTAGVTVGLALQGGLANLAGGVLLLLFKPFVVGDYIIQDQSNGCEGTVAKIEICYTTLLSIDNKKVVVPNGTLSNSTIINVTAKENRKLEIKVGISYEADIQKAKTILEKILKDDPDTKSDSREMVVFVDELAESAVIMGLRVWVATESYWAVKWRLNQKIKEEFDANGIVIPYKQMEVYVHQK